MSEDILINIGGNDSEIYTYQDLRTYYPNDGSSYKVFIENFNFVSEYIGDQITFKYDRFLLNLYIEGLGNYQNYISNVDINRKLVFICDPINEAEPAYGIKYNLENRKYIGTYLNPFNNLKIYIYDPIFMTLSSGGVLDNQKSIFNLTLRFKKI